MVEGRITEQCTWDRHDICKDDEDCHCTCHVRIKEMKDYIEEIKKASKDLDEALTALAALDAGEGK